MILRSKQPFLSTTAPPSTRGIISIREGTVPDSFAGAPTIGSPHFGHLSRPALTIEPPPFAGHVVSLVALLPNGGAFASAGKPASEILAQEEQTAFDSFAFAFATSSA